MKNKCNVPLVRLFGIIALAAVIVFSMTACPGGDDDDNKDKKDGVTWKAITDTTFDNTSQIEAIAWGGAAGQEKFVAGNNYGKMAYSSNGVTWTAVADSTLTSSIKVITYGNGKFVAVAAGGKMATSPDGVTWTAVADTTVNDGIVWGKGKFVAVGGSKMAYSSDGVTWTAAVTDNTFSDYNFNAIACSDDYWGPGSDKFVAVGNNRGDQSGKMAYSSDGATWTAVADSNLGHRPFKAIAYANKFFVAATDTGKIAISNSGTDYWLTRIGDNEIDSTFEEGWGISAIAYGNNKFVIVGSRGQAAYYSGDFVTSTWTAVTNTTFNDRKGYAFGFGAISGIAYGNGKFVAVGWAHVIPDDGYSYYTVPRIAYWDGK